MAEGVLQDQLAEGVLQDQLAEGVLQDQLAEGVLQDQLAEGVLQDQLAEGVLQSLNEDYVALGWAWVLKEDLLLSLARCLQQEEEGVECHSSDIGQFQQLSTWHTFALLQSTGSINTLNTMTILMSYLFIQLFHSFNNSKHVK